MTEKTDNVERLDRTKSPPGYEVVGSGGASWAKRPRPARWSVRKSGEHLRFEQTKRWAVDAAWAHYEREHDPPGMQVRSDGLCDDAGRTINKSERWVFDVGVLSFFGPDDEGFSAEGGARAAAWRRYWRCVDLIERARKLARARDRQDLDSGLAEGWAEILTWPEAELAREEAEIAALEQPARRSVPEPTTYAPYRRGREFVVCPECRSHVLLAREFLDPLWLDRERRPMEIAFTCDWEECGAEFEATVQPPRVRKVEVLRA